MVRMSYRAIVGDGFQSIAKGPVIRLATAAYIELKHREVGVLSQVETIQDLTSMLILMLHSQPEW